MKLLGLDGLVTTEEREGREGASRTVPLSNHRWIAVITQRWPQQSRRNGDSVIWSASSNVESFGMVAEALSENQWLDSLRSVPHSSHVTMVRLLIGSCPLFIVCSRGVGRWIAETVLPD